MIFLKKYIIPNVNNEINPALLWDFGGKPFDYQKHKQIIIQRVVEFGTIEDWGVIFNKYSDDEIISAVKEINTLSNINLNFISKLFGLKKTDFKCCTKPQWRKTHWN